MNDVWRYLSQFLHDRDILNLTQVNKYFYYIIFNETFWEHKCAGLLKYNTWRRSYGLQQIKYMFTSKYHNYVVNKTNTLYTNAIINNLKRDFVVNNEIITLCQYLKHVINFVVFTSQLAIRAGSKPTFYATDIEYMYFYNSYKVYLMSKFDKHPILVAEANIKSVTHDHSSIIVYLSNGGIRSITISNIINVKKYTLSVFNK